MPFDFKWHGRTKTVRIALSDPLVLTLIIDCYRDRDPAIVFVPAGNLVSPLDPIWIPRTRPFLHAASVIWLCRPDWRHPGSPVILIFCRRALKVPHQIDKLDSVILSAQGMLEDMSSTFNGPAGWLSGCGSTTGTQSLVMHNE